MLIKKINKIKNFGVFQDFKWDKSVPEFQKHNIFYGWNYSGKSTISRIFACFENKRKHSDFPEAEFELISDNGNKYSQNDLEKLPNVRVFNTDFVDKNLKWFQFGDDIEPFFMLGEENIELQEKMKLLGQDVKRISEEKEKIVLKKETKEKEISKAYSSKAKQIKETLILPDYEKRHFEPAVKTILNNYKQLILSEENYKIVFEGYQNKNQKSLISVAKLPELNFEVLQDETLKITEKKINVKKVIAELVENPELNKWVKEGRHLHEGKVVCQYCGSEIPADLEEKFEQHYSKEYESLEKEITDLASKITNDIEAINAFKSELPDVAWLYTELSKEYEVSKNTLREQLKTYAELLSKLIEILEAKKLNPFVSQKITRITDANSGVISSNQSWAAVIKKHNDKTANFSKEQEESKAKLLNHFAAGFIDDQNLKDVTTEQEGLKKTIEDYDSDLKTKNQEAEGIERLISGTVKAAEKTNEYIQIFFRHDGIKFQITDSKKFRLMRNGIQAKNLSEGEKTIISLAYFVARLEEKGTVLGEAIVFIDDPVSSLDSNHLFNIYAFIKTKLDDCQQLFLSTHNIEFFNLLKDLLKDNGYEKKDDMPCYLVKRIWNSKEDHSIIEDLPLVLKRYRSEYAYLFGELKKFSELDKTKLDQHEFLYTMPNIARRFLEAYLGMRYPDTKSWSKKLDRLIKNDTKRAQIEKFVHTYSHEGTAIRTLKFPEAVECKEIVEDILTSLKEMDQDHFDALCVGSN